MKILHPPKSVPIRKKLSRLDRPQTITKKDNEKVERSQASHVPSTFEAIPIATVEFISKYIQRAYVSRWKALKQKSSKVLNWVESKKKYQWQNSKKKGKG